VFGKIGVPELVIFTVFVVVVLMYVRAREKQGKS